MWFPPALLVAYAAMAASPGDELASLKEILASGNCADAHARLEGYLRIHPQDPLGWHLMGDTQKCLGDHRGAVLSYRQAIRLGASETELTPIIEALASTLVIVEVRLLDADENIPPSLRLVGGGVDMEPSARVDGVYRFVDLPPGYGFVVYASGAGYAPSKIPVAPGSPGQVIEVNMPLIRRGFGTLHLEPWKEGFKVDVRDTVQLFQNVPPGDLRVTAGSLTLTISGPTGERVTTEMIGRDETVAIDLTTLLPAQVELLDLPAGSVLTWRGRGEAFGGRREIGWDGVRMDPATGVPLQPTVSIGGLSEGPYIYCVENLWLGTIEGEFVATAGSTGTVSVPWQTAPGLDAVRKAFEAYSLAYPPTQKNSISRKLLIEAGLGTAAVGAVSGTLFTLDALSARRDAKERTESYEAALDSADVPAAREEFFAREHLLARAARSTALAAVSAGLAVGGGCLALIEWRFGRRPSSKDFSSWDIRSLPPFIPSSNPSETTGGTP